jgi:hypothetical protein
MLTTALELTGVALIVAAALVAFGLAAALLVAGVACLVLSWRLTT